MSKRTAALTSAILLVLGIAAFTGSALAGNGNGNGNGDAAAPTAPAAETTSQGTAPGNSANAPGQEKKATSTSSTGGGSAIQTSTAGMKPSSATVDSKDTHAAAGSSQTKLYGNGQTAGQIAMQNGASSTDMLHGPGNSQPHKMALCPGGHEVDVHALKAKGHRKQCGVTSSTPPTTSSKPTTATNVTTNAAAAVSAAGGVQATTAAPSAQPKAPGGALGATASAGRSGRAGGVLGALQAAGHGVLPFTGFPLGIAVLLALGLIPLGLALRRIARPTV